MGTLITKEATSQKDEPKMGQLTTALKANKELRKQFKKQPVKKISKDDQKIIDAIENSDFGCQKENTYVFAEALLKRKIPRKPKENDDKFNEVVGALLVCLLKDKRQKCPFGIDTGRESYINWNNFNNASDRLKKLWRPATDKEIREYFS